jgi:hypothetical protein
MNRALRLVDVSISNAPATSPAPLSTLYPTVGYAMRSSMSPSRRPTYAPTSRATVIPTLTGSFATEPPATQRSATVHPRFEAAARHEATSLLAVMRLNLDFLQSLLHGQAAGLAVTALADLHQTIDRLERRLGASGLHR